MLLQISIFLYVYLAFLIIWFIFLIIGIYHMMRYGFKTFMTFISTFIFIAGALILLSISSNFILEIDWKEEVEILKDINFTGVDY